MISAIRRSLNLIQKELNPPPFPPPQKKGICGAC